MSSLLISVIITICLTIGAVAGALSQKILGQSLRADATKGVVETSRDMIIGLTALTLGMLVTSAKTSYDEKVVALRQHAAEVTKLGNILEDYGPETNQVIETLKGAIQNEIDILNTAAEHGLVGLRDTAKAALRQVRKEIIQLEASDENKKKLKDAAFDSLQDVITSQLKIVHDIDSKLSWPLVWILIFWLSVVFYILGLFAPINPISVICLFFSVISMSASLFLMMEYDMPYDGFVIISADPLERALRKL